MLHKLLVVSALLVCGLLSHCGAVASLTPLLAEPYVISHVGLCNADGVVAGFCHDAQRVIVYIDGADMPPTELPAILVSRPNDPFTYPCTQVAVSNATTPYAGALPSFSPRYLGAFNLTVNSSGGMSAPYTQLSYVDDLRIHSVTGCSAADSGRLLPGCVDGDCVNIMGTGFVEPLSVSIGAFSYTWSLQCSKLSVVSLERAVCQVSLPNVDPAKQTWPAS